MAMQSFKNGIDLEGWLSQCSFLPEQPPTKEHLREHFASFITEADIAAISTQDFDHVRLPISARLLYDEKHDRLDPDLTICIDHCLDWCQKYDLNIVIDLHDMSENSFDTAGGLTPLLVTLLLREHFCHVWELLARELLSAPQPLLAFEILDEDCGGSDTDADAKKSLRKQAIRRIRRIDPSRCILVGNDGRTEKKPA